jgi:hypothetical protein
LLALGVIEGTPLGTVVDLFILDDESACVTDEFAGLGDESSCAALGTGPLTFFGVCGFGLLIGLTNSCLAGSAGFIRVFRRMFLRLGFSSD